MKTEPEEIRNLRKIALLEIEKAKSDTTSIMVQLKKVEQILSQLDSEIRYVWIKHIRYKAFVQNPATFNFNNCQN